ncbi:5-formyltetrahydrofolate cyclo-ligase [Acetobacter tropicalis NBRC 101654]|uniref:5-formyltetrahydrofolate cyclo-ligase n=1 Tax=Acetobacter tropicalis NBRC 101654 TaxID=749388 RepID=F7V9T5_9PROT|nr:5-formyltetrahydrofolate cyclo-ligase [Acetobacter tropicalis]GAA07130.1 5-formyltetrahydrofolate cyclo-ligase [Acetobacter tropicalis NBRC 101654]
MVAPHSSPLQSDPPAVAEAKKQLRAHCLTALKNRDQTLDPLLCRRLSESLLALEAERIACVWPLPHELDVRPVCHALAAAGRTVLLPETPPRGHPLVFRVWTPDCVMQAGRFGTCVPNGPVLTPQAIMVPLVGFDRRGNRLGYGGGYYDRTLSTLPHADAVGYALAAQEVDHIPTGPYDHPLSCIVTEKERLHFD